MACSLLSMTSESEYIKGNSQAQQYQTLPHYSSHTNQACTSNSATGMFSPTVHENTNYPCASHSYQSSAPANVNAEQVDESNCLLARREQQFRPIMTTGLVQPTAPPSDYQLPRYEDIFSKQ